MSSVRWPSICCGCGISGPDLKQYDYLWEKESGRCGAGPRMVTKKSLGIHAMLCPACLQESKDNSKGGWYGSLLVWLLLTVVAYFNAVNSGFVPLTTFGSFLFLSAIPFMFVAAYYGLRARPFLSYIGIKPSGFGTRMIVKDTSYASAFRLANPGMEVEINMSYGGHKDFLDEGTFMIACCVFGILLPWLIPILLG